MDHHHQQHQHHHHEPPHHRREPPHHHQHHHSQPMYPTNSSLYMISTPNYTTTNNNRFPFNSSSSSPPQALATPPSKPPVHGLEPIASPYSGDVGGGSQKKKRGRPRKYSPDSGGGGGGGGIALGLSPTPLSSGGGGGGGEQGDSAGVALSPENSSKKNRGRPSGSSKKQLDALGNCGVGFTPHVILVNAGEDIASKILAFSKQGARTVCVLSANGSICDVDLRQPTMSGGVVKYEGRFEIISLSGSYLLSENNGGQVRSGGLSVSLAGTDGRVLGGVIAGVLRAATPVQIIVGSFIADGKKPKSMPSVTQSRPLSFSAPPYPAADSSPPSQEFSTEGSDENEHKHIGGGISSYGNSNHPIDHNQIYSHMNWPNPGSKMLPN
ncbi:hypothetical protein vseg_020405 [Gypsophila vaccaria]